MADNGRSSKSWPFVLLCAALISAMLYISGYTKFDFKQNIIVLQVPVPDDSVTPPLFPTVLMQFYRLCESRGVQLIVMDTTLLEAVIHQTAVNWTDVAMVTYGAFQEQQQLLSEIATSSSVAQLGLTAEVVEVPVPEIQAIKINESFGICFLLKSETTSVVIQIMILWKYKHFYTTGSYLSNVEEEETISAQPLIMETFTTKEITINGVMMRVPEETGRFLAELPVMRFIPCTKSVVFPEVNDKKTRFSQALLNISSIARKLEKPIFLFSGTLLGWYRDCSFIESTGDVDLAMFIEDYDEQFHRSLISDKEINGQIFGKISEGLQYQVFLKLFQVRIDIFFVYKDPETQEVWIQELLTTGLQKLRLIYNKEFSVCSGLLLDYIVHVPCPVLPVLEAEYGTGWNTPLPEEKWNWFSSPRNRRRPGDWDPRERSSVVRDLRDSSMMKADDTRREGY